MSSARQSFTTAERVRFWAKVVEFLDKADEVTDEGIAAGLGRGLLEKDIDPLSMVFADKEGVSQRYAISHMERLINDTQTAPQVTRDTSDYIYRFLTAGEPYPRAERDAMCLTFFKTLSENDDRLKALLPNMSEGTIDDLKTSLNNENSSEIWSNMTRIIISHTMTARTQAKNAS